MTALRVWLARVLDLALWRRRDRDLDAEIDHHLVLLEDELVVGGMDRGRARIEARRQFGGVDQVKTRYRDQRGLPGLGALLQDVRFAWRALSRDRGFALTAVVVLALGIGVNNMMFTVLNAHLIRGLPLADVDRVLSVATVDRSGIERGVSWRDFDDLRDALTSTDLVAFAHSPASLGDLHAAPDRLDRSHVSVDTFAVLGIRPLLGRDFAPGDGHAGAAPVALIAERVWRRRYAADPGIIGREILIDAAPATIVGVVTDRSGFPSGASLWQPIGQLRGIEAAARNVRTLQVYGRIRSGADSGLASAEIEAAVLALGVAHPDTNDGVRARVMAINDRHLGRMQPAWMAFMAVGCLIALISCANVANLLIGRGLARDREMALRTSLGATRARLARQLLAESALLAIAGAAIGLGIGAAGVRSFQSGLPEGALPYWVEYVIDGRVLAALVLASVLMTLVFGLIPALHGSRPDPQATLRQGGPAVSRAGAAGRWTAGFLVAELALGFVMLANLALSWRLDSSALPTDAALDARDVMTATLTLPAERYPDAGARAAFLHAFGERLHAIPGVEAAALASALPVRSVPERPVMTMEAAAGDPLAVRQVFVSTGYFAALGIPLTAGRAIEGDDGRPGPAEAVVNERFAARIFPNQDPRGRRFGFVESGADRPVAWFTIVGVAPPIRQNRPDDAIAYVPIEGGPPATVSALIRTASGPEQSAAAFRRAAREVDPHLPLYRMATLGESTAEANAFGRASSRLLLALTVIATSLAGVGLYAVIARTVGSRRRELGIRMAVGATPARLCRIVLGEALRLAALGSVAGVLAVIGWDLAFFDSVRAGEIVPGVQLADPAVLLMLAGAVAALAVAASLVPLRRVGAITPALTLGHD